MFFDARGDEGCLVSTVSSSCLVEDKFAYAFWVEPFLKTACLEPAFLEVAFWDEAFLDVVFLEDRFPGDAAPADVLLVAAAA